MGILKGILRTAKELYNADKNDQLDEYIDGKISNVIKKLDGTETAEFEDIKENRWQEICELLNPENSEEFDNDFYQDAVDIWREEFAQSTQDSIQALYGKYLGWLTTFNLISDEISDEEQETQTLVEKMEEANAQCLKNIRDAIELLDEDTIDWWICTLYTAKAERLHWVGVAYKGKNEHVEAVRLAIQALPFACNDEERERAKAAITGKVAQNLDAVYVTGGYGINGETPNALIQRKKEGAAFVYDKDSSVEDNEEMMELCAMELTEVVEHDLYDKNNLDWFSNRPYHDRQFIFTVRDLDHIGGCYDETDNIKYVFPLDELPGEITFPIGHPQPNTLYYAHPLRPMYLPFENAQLLLFYEKVHEMCRLFQCLGATQISARCLKGNKVSQEIITSSDFNVEGSYKVINASGGFQGKTAMTENSENRNEMQLTNLSHHKKRRIAPMICCGQKKIPNCAL